MRSRTLVSVAYHLVLLKTIKLLIMNAFEPTCGGEGKTTERAFSGRWKGDLEVVMLQFTLM